MRCPRCPDSVLDERVRDGIIVDACPECRGLWLDRGELEKLIAKSVSEVTELEEGRSLREPEVPARQAGVREYSQDQGGDRHRPDTRDWRHDRPRKRKTWLESLGDVFD